MEKKFRETMLSLYGSDYDDAITYCIEDAFATYGESVTLDQLFIVWGEICQQAEEMKGW